MAAPEYKLVELSTVTDEELSRVINEHVVAGWSFEGIHFAMRETQKRPSMAFVAFTRPRAETSPTDA